MRPRLHSLSATLPSPPRRTSLRLQTLALVGSTLVILLLGLYLPLRSILLDSFSRLEAETMRADSERAASAVEFALEKLDSSTVAWAIWDDTYTFIAEPNQAYLDANTNDDAFPLYDVNLMLFVDRAGQVVFGKYYDLEAQQERPLPPALLEHLGAHPELYQIDDLAGRLLGVIELPAGPLLLSARPILTSQGEGPPRGAVIFGRALDATKLAELAQLTLFPFAVYGLGAADLPADVASAREQLATVGAVTVKPLDEQQVVSYGLVGDPYDAPALITRVEQPRVVYTQGQAVLTYLSIGFLVAGAIFGAVITLVLSRLVLARILRLSADVAAVGSDLTARVATDGGDEIGDLGRAINAMIEARAQAEQARQAAEAERAQLQAASMRTQEEQVELQAQVIRMQETALADQAMPVIPVSDAVVVAPLVGTLDAARVAQLVPRLLEQTERQGARVVVLDITGVPVVDATVAQALLRATQAVRFLGAQVVVTGISPDVAQTMVALGLDLERLRSQRTLQEGIRLAERLR